MTILSIIFISILCVGVLFGILTIMICLIKHSMDIKEVNNYKERIDENEK